MSGKGTVLIVDDTPDSLLLLSDTLIAEGYDVRPADSGELALASLAASIPDLILLDIRMPGIDGLEVCRRIKANRQTCEIPVICVSATSEVEERLQALKIGAVDFVSKPFQKEELLARIRTHLDLSRLRLKLEQQVIERTAKLKAANQQLRVELRERIRTEQALRESEARFRSMADAVPALMWTSGADTKINFCNRYGLTFIGCSLDEVVRDGLAKFIHAEDLTLRYPAQIPLIESHRDYRTEHRIRRADGEYRWFLDTATPRFLSNGEFAGYMGVGVDITDLKRSLEELSAQQKLESLGTLVSGICHNFNNMLGSMIAEADLVLSELSPVSEAHGSVSRINAIALRACEMISLLTAYSRPGGVGPFAVVDIAHVVQETARLFRATVSKRLDLNVELPKTLPSIRADPAQIRQLVLNLLTNAWEALRQGEGSIRVSASIVCIASGRANGNQPDLMPGSYVLLEVSDTGCGIPETIRSKIFDPFFSTKSFGRGLGLAAAQGIVKQLNGGIQVQCTPGQGAKFEILLPCSDSGPSNGDY